jgi:hypothetical protein
MSDRRRGPAKTDEGHNLCPVCGKRSYSAAGTHPQCAQTQADAMRKKQLAAEKAAEEKQPSKASRQQNSWKKTCPKCDTEVHVRKKVCSCGHDFGGR